MKINFPEKIGIEKVYHEWIVYVEKEYRDSVFNVLKSQDWTSFEESIFCRYDVITPDVIRFEILPQYKLSDSDVIKACEEIIEYCKENNDILYPNREVRDMEIEEVHFQFDNVFNPYNKVQIEDKLVPWTYNYFVVVKTEVDCYMILERKEYYLYKRNL